MLYRLAPRAASVVLIVTLATGVHHGNPLWAQGAAARQNQIQDPSAPPAPTAPQADPAAQPALPGAAPAALPDSTPSPGQRDIECVAKVIVHEAGNQSRRGQTAVAQVIRTRMRTHGGQLSACAVVRQRGQFFAVDAYQPAHSSARWAQAVDIAAATLRGEGEDIVPGALFFHAASAPMPGHVRIARIEGHVFYR